MKMKRVLWISGIILGVLVVLVVGVIGLIVLSLDADPFAPLYADNCSTCHGEYLEGAAQGPALIGRAFTHGDSVAEIAESIARGFPQTGMQGWSTTLNEGQVQSLAILIAEKRVDREFADFKTDTELVIPQHPIESELLSFWVETVATGLDPFPFSIAPLPDGRILLTEKQLGLSVISVDGEQSELVEGTPETSNLGIDILGLRYGIGWLLDVALHPDYENNGWIYLLHAHLCDDCDSMLPVTMNRVVRGRIEEGVWVDQEIIWSVEPEFLHHGPGDRSWRTTGPGPGRLRVSQRRHEGPGQLRGHPGTRHTVRQDPPGARRWARAVRQPVCRRRRRAAQHLVVWPPQSAGTRGQPEDAAAVGNRDGPVRRR